MDIIYTKKLIQDVHRDIYTHIYLLASYQTSFSFSCGKLKVISSLFETVVSLSPSPFSFIFFLLAMSVSLQMKERDRERERQTSEMNNKF